MARKTKAENAEAWSTNIATKIVTNELKEQGFSLKEAKKNRKLWAEAKREFRERKAKIYKLLMEKIDYSREHWELVRESMTDRYKNNKDIKWDSLNAIKLDVPFQTQMDEKYGNKSRQKVACLRASMDMAKAMGANIKKLIYEKYRIQIANQDSKEDKFGSFTEFSKDKAIEGKSYIDSELGNKRPVIVGVSHKANSDKNVDNVTDHFVVITGRDYDPETDRVYYTFHDPASAFSKKEDGKELYKWGSDENPNNRFYVDEKTGKLYKDKPDEGPTLTGKKFEVSMVRFNEESREDWQKQQKEEKKK